MTLAGLLGLKPALETLRDLLDAKPFPKQVLPNEFMLMITRMVELVFESSPETLIQATAFLATDAEDQTLLQVCVALGGNATPPLLTVETPTNALSLLYPQYISLLSSIAAIGALTTLADRELDTT